MAGLVQDVTWWVFPYPHAFGDGTCTTTLEMMQAISTKLLGKMKRAVEFDLRECALTRIHITALHAVGILCLASHDRVWHHINLKSST